MLYKWHGFGKDVEINEIFTRFGLVLINRSGDSALSWPE
jgi:hypothetical protein